MRKTVDDFQLRVKISCFTALKVELGAGINAAEKSLFAIASHRCVSD
jgi:hypothetical protein